MKTNTVAENLRTWDQDHAWPEDGDEWKGQAVRCGVPYEDWKQALVTHLIEPFVPQGGTVVEIAPGHGRWTEFLAARAGRLVLVDLSPSCLDHCRRRFSDLGHLDYHRTQGCDLPAGLDGQVDTVWSFDAVVHMDAAVIAGYLGEIARVLRPGGRAVLHHANRRPGTLWLGGLRRLGPRGQRAYRLLSLGADEWDDGWRADVSARRFAALARRAGLTVEDQISRWGPDGRYGVPRYRDRVSLLRKPG